MVSDKMTLFISSDDKEFCITPLYVHNIFILNSRINNRFVRMKAQYKDYNEISTVKDRLHWLRLSYGMKMVYKRVFEIKEEWEIQRKLHK